MAIFVFWQLPTDVHSCQNTFLHFPYTCFISTSMRNFMFLALKWLSYGSSSTFDSCWPLKRAVNRCQNMFYLQLILLTSFMQNFEFLALTMTELWLFKYFWQLLTAVISCQQLSKNFPDVCLTLCCFPISIFKLCLCVNSACPNISLISYIHHPSKIKLLKSFKHLFSNCILTLGPIKVRFFKNTAFRYWWNQTVLFKLEFETIPSKIDNLF